MYVSCRRKTYRTASSILYLTYKIWYYKQLILTNIGINNIGINNRIWEEVLHYGPIMLFLSYGCKKLHTA